MSQIRLDKLWDQDAFLAGNTENTENLFNWTTAEAALLMSTATDMHYSMFEVWPYWKLSCGKGLPQHSCHLTVCASAQADRQSITQIICHGERSLHIPSHTFCMLEGLLFLVLHAWNNVLVLPHLLLLRFVFFSSPHRKWSLIYYTTQCSTICGL